jgi:hypothetical protein
MIVGPSDENPDIDGFVLLRSQNEVMLMRYHRYYLNLDGVGITQGETSKTYSDIKQVALLDSSSTWITLPLALAESIVADLAALNPVWNASWWSGAYVIDCPGEEYAGYSLDFVFGESTINVGLIQKYQWDTLCVLGLTNTTVEDFYGLGGL